MLKLRSLYAIILSYKDNVCSHEYAVGVGSMRFRRGYVALSLHHGCISTRSAPAPYHHYVNYLNANDIHAYSIDECLIGLTLYFVMYNRFLKGFMKRLMDGIYNKLGICATGGVGTNIFS